MSFNTSVLHLCFACYTHFRVQINNRWMYTRNLHCESTWPKRNQLIPFALHFSSSFQIIIEADPFHLKHEKQFSIKSTWKFPRFFILILCCSFHLFINPSFISVRALMVYKRPAIRYNPQVHSFSIFRVYGKDFHPSILMNFIPLLTLR